LCSLDAAFVTCLAAERPGFNRGEGDEDAELVEGGPVERYDIALGSVDVDEG
jgi:hypothetical protein